MSSFINRKKIIQTDFAKRKGYALKNETKTPERAFSSKKLIEGHETPEEILQGGIEAFGHPFQNR
jgi:hypothetical protein